MPVNMKWITNHARMVSRLRTTLGKEQLFSLQLFVKHLRLSVSKKFSF